MSDAIIEAPLVLTLKSSDDRDAPWLVLRASNVQQLQSQLLELESCALFADVGRVAAMFNVQARLGSQLGAKGIDPAVDGGSFAGVTAAPIANAVASTPPPAPPAAEPAKPAAKFPSFKAPAQAATPPAAPAPSAPRQAAEPPAAAPAANGFPAAPQWKKS